MLMRRLYAAAARRLASAASDTQTRSGAPSTRNSADPAETCPPVRPASWRGANSVPKCK